jgi:hypothetical protein
MRLANIKNSRKFVKATPLFGSIYKIILFKMSDAREGGRGMLLDFLLKLLISMYNYTMFKNSSRNLKKDW